MGAFGNACVKGFANFIPVVALMGGVLLAAPQPLFAQDGPPGDTKARPANVTKHARDSRAETGGRVVNPAPSTAAARSPAAPFTAASASRVATSWRAPASSAVVPFPSPLRSKPARPNGLVPYSWGVENCNLVWTPGPNDPTHRVCTHDANYRDASPLSECPGQDRSGLLCYPNCKAGYSGVGPVCWKECPEGYHDDGAFCRKDVRIIGANNNACPWYDKCGLALSRGCSTCPAGYHNDGCTCRMDADIFAKDTYTRGAGSPMQCDVDKERIAALCYGECPSGTHKDGIYCTDDAETCHDVADAPPTSGLQRYCFVLESGDSWVEPCRPIATIADSLEHAEQIAHCTAINYSIRQTTCEEFDQDLSCR